MPAEFSNVIRYWSAGVLLALAIALWYSAPAAPAPRRRTHWLASTPQRRRVLRRVGAILCGLAAALVWYAP